MVRGHGSCSVHSEHDLVCCDVVLALWMEHGGRMRVARVEGGGDGDGEDQVESWRIEGKGQKSSRVARRSRPGYARETQPVLMRGHVRYFPRAMWWHRGKMQVEMEGPMLKREPETKAKQM